MSKNIAKRKQKIKIKKILLIAVVLYTAVLFGRQRRLKRQLEAKRDRYDEEIAMLQEEIEDLEEEVENSDSLKFIEKIAREELGMVKPREIIVLDKNKNDRNYLEENTALRD